MQTATKLGAGNFTYTPVEGWEKRPANMKWREVAGVAVDPKDNVYLFTRDPGAVVVCDPDGNVKSSWGQGLFKNPHGLTIGLEGDTLFCIDNGDHTVRKTTLDGVVLLTIGTPGKTSPLHSGKPFNKCTHVALDPRSGDIYVSDGYGNSAVHKYDPNGKHLFSWGTPGTDPGQFNLPHNIVTDKDGYVYVADRENHRIQIFNSKGGFEDQIVNMHRPCAIYMSRDGYLYNGELGFGMPVNKETPNLGPRISIYDTKKKRLA
ncbi:MAG: peptidyl-alpha-hydroxyglycine alpha-amidating lyase family protein, partial [Chloroflexi bacterium]|nr:peptidyl-alpha-hydroxyglycine alpha-amidating lyase family protein [Chloroflexota bacterium]